MLLRIFDKVSEILAEFEKAATPYAVCLLQVEVADSLDRLDSMTPPDWSNPWSSPFDPPVSQIAVYLSEKHVRDLLIALRELESRRMQEANVRVRGPENLALIGELGSYPPESFEPAELSEARRLRHAWLAAQNAVYTCRKKALEDLRQRVEAAIEGLAVEETSP